MSDFDYSSMQTMVAFALNQLCVDNQAHAFEFLCFELARATVAPNLQVATGPVAGSGDQGRDFETFPTFVGVRALSPSYAREEGRQLAFACTLQQSDIDGKVFADLDKIGAAGSRQVDAVYYYSGGADVKVATRHKLERDARQGYDVELYLFDRRNISNLICASTTWHLARKYLSIRTPAEQEKDADPTESYYLARKHVSARATSNCIHPRTVTMLKSALAFGWRAT